MAEVDKGRREHLKLAWLLWLFPLCGLIIAGWLMKGYLSQRGPTIYISFDDGSGIEPEKTKVRFRGVTIGTVKSVVLDDDAKNVIAEVALQSDARHFAVDGTKFWVVLPKVNLQGISGLETFFEGTYIATQPGRPNGKRQFDFKGHVGAESMDSLEDTTAYFLETPRVESINIGDPVQFRGLVIGSVSKVGLEKSAQIVNVQINIQNRYVRVIRTNSVFWSKTGVQANLGWFKSEIKVSSLESLWRGGIEVFTPDGPGQVAKALTHFNLDAGPPKDFEKWNPRLD